MTASAPPPGALDSGQSRLNATAVLSLLAGLSGFFCFWGFGGLLGLILGLVARSEIERSEGRQHGKGLATAGVVVGGLNFAAFVIGVAALIAWMAGSSASASSAPPPAYVGSPPPAPALSPGSRAGEGESALGEATRERETRVTQVGQITLVDPGSSAGKLRDFLREQQTRANQSHQTLVVWVVSLDCAPCNGVAAALPDGRLQRALERVRLVRLDVREYAPDLERIGIPIQVFPGFVLMDQELRPRDYVNGGEWGADIASQIAPVLGAFVRGTYSKRKNPWQGPERGDETAL